MNLLSLPPELFVVILSKLEVKDILAFEQVNHFTNDFDKKSSILQYLITLYKTGMKDVQGLSELSTRDRLAYLSGREALWTSLDLIESRKIKIPVFHRHSHISDISNSTYIFGELSELPENIRTNNLWYSYLPNCIHEEGHPKSETWWKHFSLETEALSVGFSLEEYDLLAVLTSKELP